MIYSIRANNSEVTDFYLSIIEKAISNVCDGRVEIVPYKNEKEMRYCAEDIIISPSMFSTLLCWKKGGRHIITWFQGIAPEESFLRNQSKIREIVLSLIEKRALRKSQICFFVSEAMLLFYEKKYRIKLREKSFIMPCFNEYLHTDSFKNTRKYADNIFAYVGSLEKYQGFETILDEYKRIEDLCEENVELLVLTKNEEEATELIKCKQIKNYNVKYVPKDKVYEELGKAKFGFIMREDIVVNRVATPTKISNYMSCGVIPIFSSCLEDFYKVTYGMHYVLCVDDETYQGKLERLLNDKSCSGIEVEYSKLFSEYFNEERYQSGIEKLLSSWVNNNE